MRRRTSRVSKTQLRRAVAKQLRLCGFKRNGHGYTVDEGISKDSIRALHLPLKNERLSTDCRFLNEKIPHLKRYFAAGTDVIPDRIKPLLVEVHSDTPEADLFRLATKFWSVPVSQGFGRRMRYLVMDESNNKLIGIFALGDPVFNLSARDELIGWTSKDREKRLINVMDAYIVGAVPPYSMLIGGKLVAALMTSNEVRKSFAEKYGKRLSVIARSRKHAQLVLITTTSALGRSSLYNRLAIPDGARFNRIGTTIGYGHFHLAGDAFVMMRKYLVQRRHPYASGNKFGQGPNWRLRVIRAALVSVGLNADGIMKHGVGREVYAVPLATNWKEILLGKQKRAQFTALTASEIADYCLKRWIIPRSQRDPSFKEYRPEATLESFLTSKLEK
jgi:hypothetical protein